MATQTEFAKAEGDIDQVFEELPLFGLPRYVALGALVQEFELALHQFDLDLGRRSQAGYINMLNYKPAAALLASSAWARCQLIEDDDDSYHNSLGFAADGMKFALLYGLLTQFFPGAHRGQLVARVEDRRITLEFASPTGQNS